MSQSPLPQSGVWVRRTKTISISIEYNTTQKVELVPTANNFPVKLWRVVNDAKMNRIIWNDQGDGIIVNKNLTEKEFLSVDRFNIFRFSDFIHKLNSYGFKESKHFSRDKRYHYFHPYFKKNQPKLLPLVTRCIKKSRPSAKDVYLKKETQTERRRNHRNLDETEDDISDVNLHNGESCSVYAENVCSSEPPSAINSL